MKHRLIPTIVVMSIASLSLTGVGVHATFTTSTASGQTITVGTVDPTLSGSCVSGANCPVDASNTLYTLSPDGTKLTFAPDTPSSPSFTTGDEQVTATNTGTIPVTDPTWVLNAGAGSQLEAEAYVCATSTGIGTGTTNYLLYNGPLTSFLGTSYALSGDTLSIPGATATATSGPTDNFVIDVYAGSEPTACGTSFTNATGLVNGTYQLVGVGSTATPGVSEAPTLNGDSTGQSIAISAELTYQG
jgi:hypothetical protein